MEALPQDMRVVIVRIRRGAEIIEPTLDMIIRRDDVVAVMARQQAHVERGTRVGPEVDDKALLEIPIETLEVVVTQGSWSGNPGTCKTLRARWGFSPALCCRTRPPLPYLVARGDLLR